MEGGKKLIEKLTNGKKLEKDQCLILVLAGILLCVIALPARKDDSKSDIPYISSDTIDNQSEGSTDGIYGEPIDSAASYAGYWEERLEDALRYVDGVGNVRVLITLKESEHRIVEKDGTEQYSNTTEEDAAGGSRTIGESRVEKSTIYTVDEKGQDVPYVIKTISPTVEGVVVIAQGVKEQGVQDNIIEAIQVLFDIDANKIKIVKMKNNQ
ncbi:MAG: stage III sporulation protein AG [Lachnospiraceae bacterium]|nr:stage III sporulation protein AG [Lachnospiraceae bacterium]